MERYKGRLSKYASGEIDPRKKAKAGVKIVVKDLKPAMQAVLRFRRLFPKKEDRPEIQSWKIVLEDMETTLFLAGPEEKLQRFRNYKVDLKSKLCPLFVPSANRAKGALINYDPPHCLPKHHEEILQVIVIEPKQYSRVDNHL